MEWKYEVGDEVMFTCTDSMWAGVGPVRATVVRKLTELEADFEETGPMYEVKFDLIFLDPSTGSDKALLDTFTAFEDELREI